MKEELGTHKRGHLIDILSITKKGIAHTIATYNCKKDTLVLYNPQWNVLLEEQIFIRSSLAQMQDEYKEEVK